MKRDTLLRVLGGAALGAGAAAETCRFAAAADAPSVINVGAFPVDNVGPLYYAQSLGYFRDAGLDVRITPMGGNPAATVAAAIGGTLDIGIGNVVTIAQTQLSGFDVKFIAPGAIVSDNTLTDVILVTNDSPIRTAADLSGKTVGLFGLKSLQQIAFMSWVDQHHGSSKAITYVEIPLPEMVAALSAHRVDAVLLTEPFVVLGKSVTRSLGSEFAGFAPHFMLLGYVATQTWLRGHAAEAQAFVSAIRRASVWGNAHRAESGSILAGASKLDPGTVAGMARSTYGLDLTPSLLQPVIDGAMRYGMLSAPVTASQMIWKPS